MEDDKIKELFQNFKPELTSDAQFMADLLRSMHAVELVRQQNAAMHRHSKKALVIASLTGFVVGVLLMLLTPLVGSMITGLNITLPTLAVSGMMVDYHIFIWAFIGLASVFTSLNAYELAVAKMSTAQHTAHGASSRR